MNITFLVGNGFDMSLGIDTSYKGFYQWYCNQPSNNDFIKKFKENIQNDLEGTGENWADFEMGLAMYTNNFTIDTVSDFCGCYEDAHENIITYLEQEKSKYDIEIPLDEEKRLRDGLSTFYNELSPKEKRIFDKIFDSDKHDNSQINFISFNYTDLLDKCINTLSKQPLLKWQYNTIKTLSLNSNVVHIHGTSDEFPILGVSNESQIKNQELLEDPRFSEIMIKSKSVDAVGQFWYDDAEQLIKTSKIICILGMSLGASDMKWWNDIISWLNSDAKRRLIVFWYTRSPIDKRSIFKNRTETENIKDMFLKYSDLEKSKIDLLKSRIHVVINTKEVLNVSKEAIKEKVLIL